MAKTRICVIGAGPSGMSMVYNFSKMETGNDAEIVCFDKQDTWGGQWNFSWRTGTDEYGEPCHNGMYKYLWSNGPKECLEYPDYTFEEHFGKPVPSFPPRPVMRDYIEGRMKKCAKDLKACFRFKTAVRFVKYNEMPEDNFSVTFTNLEDNKTVTETFTHVVVAIGIFNSPKIPNFPGIESFGGRVLHSHNFRDPNEFKGQRLLVIGASYSAEDIAIQCCKFGAKSIISSWRTKPMGFKWPKGIEEKPLVEKFDSNMVHFTDGTSAEVDTVIYCTGYLYLYPFMDENLKLKSPKLTMYPDNVYKGTLWLGGGNNKVFYIGMVDQYFSFTLFDVQTLWTCKYIFGELNEQTQREDLEKSMKEWVNRRNSLKDCHDEIDFQGDLITVLSKDTGYNIDSGPVGAKLFHTWEHQREADIVTYKDQCFPSIYTKSMAPAPSCKYSDALDDSIQAYTGAK
ncbi:hypothetical protein ACF0H5_016317 [Mactra antiquata]